MYTHIYIYIYTHNWNLFHISVLRKAINLFLRSSSTDGTDETELHLYIALGVTLLFAVLVCCCVCCCYCCRKETSNTVKPEKVVKGSNNTKGPSVKVRSLDPNDSKDIPAISRGHYGVHAIMVNGQKPMVIPMYTWGSSGRGEVEGGMPVIHSGGDDKLEDRPHLEQITETKEPDSGVSVLDGRYIETHPGELASYGAVVKAVVHTWLRQGAASVTGTGAIYSISQ